MLKPVNIDKKEIARQQENINLTIENTPISAIPFTDVVNGPLKDKIWTGITDNEIELMPGYIDGDTTKPCIVSIGDAHVHALMSGATGKGKSVTLHAIINYMRYRYPPNELAIYHADFKRMEGNKYRLHGGSLHHRAITGTSSPSYVSSIFSYIKSVMVYRERLFSFGGENPNLPIEQCSPSQILAFLAHKVGITPIEKIKHYKQYIRDGKIGALNNEIKKVNEYLKSKGMTPLDLVPTEMARILLIVDEFQQAFEIDDDDAVDTLKKDIKALTSKGRALGVHLFFASQNMTGTVSDDILGQFDLRFILNCAPDVSTELLGNKLACELDIGQCIVSETASDPDGTKCITVKVPLSTDADLEECTKYGHETIQTINYKQQKMLYFDEQVPEQEETLKHLLDKSNVIKRTSKFLIGTPCIIQGKPVPVLTDLARPKDITLLISSKESQLYSMLHTMLRNIDVKDNSVIVYYDSAKELETDLSYLTKLPNGNIKQGLDNTINLSTSINTLSAIYESKTVYLVINKIDAIDGLNRAYTYDEDEELIPLLLKLPQNMRLILTANKANIKQDLLESVRYVLNGYVDVDTQYSLGLKRSYVEEVNVNEYLGLYTDKGNGQTNLFKMYMSNNLKSTTITEDLDISII